MKNPDKLKSKKKRIQKKVFKRYLIHCLDQTIHSMPLEGIDVTRQELWDLTVKYLRDAVNGINTEDVPEDWIE